MSTGARVHTVNTAEIRVRDPFILPRPAEGAYYLFGTTDSNVWSGPGEGFDCYRGTDLATWEGPLQAFRPPAGFWGTTNFWAPEVHEYRDSFFLFASFNAPGSRRGTQVLRSARPEGPYLPISDGPVTPREWECIDGTLHVDQDGQPWMVFCHEWVQIGNGTICAMKLTPDLAAAASAPITLFTATEAPWVTSLPPSVQEHGHPWPGYVTDGPFMHRCRDGSLLMLWSSFGSQDYAMGIARSRSGTINGPWDQEVEPIWGRNGGHGMVFRAFDGRLFMTLHTPNETPNERAILVPVEEKDGTLRRA